MCEDAILNRNSEATEKLLERAEIEKTLIEERKAGGVDHKKAKAAAEWRNGTVKER